MAIDVASSSSGGAVMKLAGIFRFELAYQLRRPWPWLAMTLVHPFRPRYCLRVLVEGGS